LHADTVDLSHNPLLISFSRSAERVFTPSCLPRPACGLH